MVLTCELVNVASSRMIGWCHAHIHILNACCCSARVMLCIFSKIITCQYNIYFDTYVHIYINIYRYTYVLCQGGDVCIGCWAAVYNRLCSQKAAALSVVSHTF